MKCGDCKNWITTEKTVYGDGTEIVRRQSRDGHGQCEALKIETVAAFGCISFDQGDDHIQVERKSGAPWHHFVMIPCPNCNGRGSGDGADHRCAGTGLVRKYDDGYIGDERTRKHPKEIEQEKQDADAKRRAAAQAVIDGLPLPPEPEVIDGTVLKLMPRPNVL